MARKAMIRGRVLMETGERKASVNGMTIVETVAEAGGGGVIPVIFKLLYNLMNG